MKIDLRSDTVTRPTAAMKEAMFNAVVGDDVFGEDPTVNELEAKAAAMFGMEAGLFCPSGTMTNQIAIKVHTQPLHEVICDRTAHIYNYEGGGIAFNSAASVRLIDGNLGRIKPEQVEAAINPDNVHYPITSLVSIENTANRGGGSYYTIEEMAEIGKMCRKYNLKFHLDGARIFNALVALGKKPDDMSGIFDSISICLSKGLGTPVGSVLLGNKDFIKQARRVRKVLGGGMRQAGYLAAAGIYALDNHIHRLAEDHNRATRLAESVKQLTYVEQLLPVATNIVVFKLKEELPIEQFLNKLSERNILAVPFGPQTVRMVTHLDINDEMVEKTIKALKEI